MDLAGWMALNRQRSLVNGSVDENYSPPRDTDEIESFKWAGFPGDDPDGVYASINHLRSLAIRLRAAAQILDRGSSSSRAISTNTTPSIVRLTKTEFSLVMLNSVEP
jgi:hypothetical protein